jgi:hypothetical protein
LRSPTLDVDLLMVVIAIGAASIGQIFNERPDFESSADQFEEFLT